MTADFRKQIVALCKRHIPDMRLLYLFGSHASEQANKSSDVDLAIIRTKKMLAVTRWDIQQALAIELNKNIDLVDLLTASTVMQNEIINKGVCLYDESSYQTNFEIQVMSMYQHLNEERSELLSEFRRG